MKTSFVAPTRLITVLLFAAACGSRPNPPGRLENVGGSSGREPDAATAGGSSGTGAEPEVDAGTQHPDRLDAGDAVVPDAGDAGGGAAEPDAGPLVEEGCVIDSLADECNTEPGCPELDEAADWLLAEEPVAVVRRTCEGGDGTRYITVGGGFGDSSTGYIYDAESGELVSKYSSLDVADFCSDSTPSSIGFHGRVVWDCASVNPNDTTRPCPRSNGPGNGENYPDECIYVQN